MYNNVRATCFGRFLTGHHEVEIQCQRNNIPTINIVIIVSTQKGCPLPPLWTTPWHIYITYDIFYNTTSKYINPDTCVIQLKKFVQHTTVHKLVLKNYHKESPITFRCRIFPFFYYPTNQFGIRTYKGNQMNANVTLIISHTSVRHQTS